MNDDDR